MSLGTPTYMSPEQAFAEKDIDGRSDMYSLACVLYEMLTGEPPFTGPNAQAIMARHSMSEVPSMKIVRATVPDEVELVVEKALAKSPADRYATIEEFAQELEECVIDYHTTTRRAVTDRRTAPRIPPGRRAADVEKKWFLKPAFLGGVAALLIILGGAGWWKFGRTPSGLAATSGGFEPTKVAVMYFQDVSPTGQLGYLADGLTENLISRLGEVSALDVVSQNGVAPYRGTSVPADSIARAFSAGTVVRGTVEPDGNKVRIRVRLIDGNTGDQTNDVSFEQASANIVGAQDSLASKVADMLRERIGSEVAIRQSRSGTANAGAWTLYQRAQRLRKDADAFVAKADATSAEKTYATADSLLNVAAGLDASWTDPVVARASIDLARANAEKNAIGAKPWIEQGISKMDDVLAKHPRDAGALETRGNLRYLKWAYSLTTNPKERNDLIAGAEQDLSAAVQIEPTRASAWSTLSTVYSQQDNITKAKTAAQRAYEADAYLSSTDEVLWKLYATSYDQEQFTDAVKYCEDGGKRFPENPRFVRCRLWLLTVKSLGKPDVNQAWKDYERLKVLTPPQNWPMRQLEARMLVSAALARAGMIDSAHKVIATARPDPADDKDGELAGVEAFIRTLFGTAQDTTEAFNILNRYISGSPQHAAGLKASETWWWKGLKQDKRFEELVAGAR
jgi:serine/threonine-protein kinase